MTAPLELEAAAASGWVRCELVDSAGVRVGVWEGPNTITQVGEQMAWEQAFNIAGALPRQTGVKFGTGSTAPAKTGAAAALTTYLANSHVAIDAGYPTSTLVTVATVLKRRATFVITVPVGKATSASVAITEVVMVNTALADSTSAASATLARALIPQVNSSGAATPMYKAADQVLILTWLFDLATT